ncbi:heat shock protein 9/12-domain-containing protein [Pyrenochaeta sp. MPI-SDFR-AT-0127]|nr:heat shock protein 9/12-domain-containing protein [Pyrenochaeta sp. MPI-SDFR-AT-0127]
MSDAFRKDFSTKAGEKLTPDSSKSTLTKAKEAITGAGDKTVRGIQPDSSKSHSQSIGDKFGRSKDEAVHGSSGGSIVDKTKNALGLGTKHV